MNAMKINNSLSFIDAYLFWKKKKKKKKLASAMLGTTRRLIINIHHVLSGDYKSKFK